MRSIPINPGQTYHYWTVVEERPVREKHRMALCICKCGTEKVVTMESLRQGSSKSCGCLRIQTSFRHGGYKSAEYRAWNKIRQRCHNPKNDAWSNYGGRGIAVCDRWRENFENFIEDMGSRPTPDHSIDRIDNDGDYKPSNCKWATRSEQIKNRRDTKWRRVVLILAGNHQLELLRMMKISTDEEVAQWVAYAWKPEART